MRHVDDGTIHAWLDRQVADPAEAAWVDAHLRECPACSARLAAERALLTQADALLGSVAPVADASRAAFEALVARSHGGAGSGGATPVPLVRVQRWIRPASWAASVVLAAALGWAVHDQARRDSDPRREAQLSSPSARPDSASPAEQAPAAVTPRLAQAPTAISPSNRASPATRAGHRARSGQAASGLPSPGPPAIEPSPSATLSVERLRAAQDDKATVPAPESAFTLSGTAPDGRKPASQFADTQGATSRPAAVSPPQGGGGGGGGGAFGGLRGGAAAGATGRTGATDGSVAGRVTAGAADTLEWRALPRTDAAAQSGMALYGIDGLTQMVTMLNAGKSAVRTLYRLESGETIELMQERVSASARSNGALGALGAGTARGSAPATATADPSPWTIVRDNVRLTLSGTANLTALGARLRLD